MLIKNHKSMLLLALLLSFGSVTVMQVQAAKAYEFKTVKNDPSNVMMYTLPNGLQVFLSVNKNEPRIQTYIAVKVGSKNDPLETTGLAHYFEHMMFKGTSNFGTMDYAKEKPILTAISDQFDIYRELKDSAQRAASYHVIDSLSYEASKLAIPNEYDKLMASIGSSGTNAGTSYDFTIYIENVPSNQLENWGKIQADRFKNMTLRLFHTEIETVYEEKNMSLTKDGRRVGELLLQTLYPAHPYGLHNVLGLQEHLKNPSVKNIQHFYETYYVPNNMAIVLCGDFDPQEAMATIEKHFGSLQSKPLPEYKNIEGATINAPFKKEIVGLEAESISIGFPMAGATSKEAMLGDLLGSMLYNEHAGLLDLNLNQTQKVMYSYAYASTMVDNGIFIIAGMPKAEQTLDQLKDLMLAEFEKVKKGEFPDWMLAATIDNKKYEKLKEMESIEDRGMAIANSYIEGKPWEESVKYLDELAKVTKEDIVKFANDLSARNYVAIHKRQGEPDKTDKIGKPSITPIVVNRDVESAFLSTVKNESERVKAIEPQFIDYEKDIVKERIGDKVDLYYAHNAENPTFELTYLFEMGSNNDLLLDLAASYLSYLGTSKLTAAQIQEEFYKIACSYNATITSERIYVTISGLSDNMTKAISLFENLITDCRPDEQALESLKSDILKIRNDQKSDQRANVSALLDYAMYGPTSPTTHILPVADLMAVKASDLVKKVKGLFSYDHSILYYGPQDLKTLASLVEKQHKLPKKMVAIPAAVRFEPLATASNRIVFAPYEAKQAYCYTVSKGVKYNKDLMPVINMYNSYFGGGMNAIVFQELREKRSLAYQSASFYKRPSQPDNYFVNIGLIVTQNDKVLDAFTAINELFEEMPQSQKTFELGKSSTLSDIRTSRAQKTEKIFKYLSDKKYGYTEDSRKVLYEAIPAITMEEVAKFQKENVKGQPKTYVILGKEADFDFDKMEKLFGKVEKVSTQDIFGY